MHGCLFPDTTLQFSQPMRHQHYHKGFGWFPYPFCIPVILQKNALQQQAPDIILCASLKQQSEGYYAFSNQVGILHEIRSSAFGNAP